jgi:polyferredoxin
MTDDPPDPVAQSWHRYRRLMRWMTLVSLAAVVVTLALLWWSRGPLPILFLVFTAGGVFFAVLLAAALMGLVFVSAASGHDDQIQDFSEDKPYP